MTTYTFTDFLVDLDFADADYTATAALTTVDLFHDAEADLVDLLEDLLD